MIKTNNEFIEYTVTRSKRKTVGIYVRNGSVEVRAPLKYPKSEIDRFVASKEKWIKTKLEASQKRAAQKESFSLNYGDFILYRGNAYRIIKTTGTKAGFDGSSFYLPDNLEPEAIKRICIKIYRSLAKIHIAERVAVFAEKMGVTPTAVKINSAKTRWGSCSSRKSLNFSWRLIMADDEIIDYVVVHELAHFFQMNHSTRFWAVVAGVIPNYLERKVRLKILQKRLTVVNWE